VAFYRERYADIGWSENSLYPGILDQLSILRRAGYTMCLATSKAHSYARKITAHFGISEFLSYEFGSELDGTRSDKTSLLAHGLKTAGAKADHAIMVGDRHYDAVGAKANGIKVIGAEYGYGSEVELSKAAVDTIIFSPFDLAEAVIRILPPRTIK
jgi:phosphoglycolate phosphatase